MRRPLPPPPAPQLKLDEARAVQAVEARMTAAQQQKQEAAEAGQAAAALAGRSVSNLQLEVQAEQALADEQEGEAGTTQTLLELCSRERQRGAGEWGRASRCSRKAACTLISTRCNAAP